MPDSTSPDDSGVLEITATRAHQTFGELLKGVVEEKGQVVLTHMGKRVAAIIPIEDYDFLAKTIDDLCQETLKGMLSDEGSGDG